MTLLNKLRINSYYYSLLLMMVALPLSKALLSISLVLLILSWIITPGIKNRLQILWSRKSVWFFIMGYLIVLIGLFYSTNIQRNIFLLFNIKICLVILPIIIGTSGQLTKSRLITLLTVFTGANLVASFVSTLILFQVLPYEIKDVREISVFIESIRFALLIVLNILLLFYVFYFSENRKYKFLHIVTIIWFVCFLNFMQAITGIVVLAITLIIVILFFWRKIKLFWKLAFILFSILSVTLTFSLFTNVVNLYHSIHVENLSKLDSLTVNGNPYIHNLNDSSRINGYLINIYVSEKELCKEWKKVSPNSLDSFDARGYNSIKNTLILYMSSKGLRKDSADFLKLKKRDIKNIEAGYTNAELAGIGIKARIYDLVREFDVWQKTGLPGGSVTIRINAMVNGWKVFKKNPWIGTGYGDINDEIQNQFEADNKVFGEPMRQNPHNQFFTILIGSGIIGFLIFIVSLILPGIIENKYRSYLFLTSFCVVVLSFLSDDTLERMIGCIITALFFSLFLYAVPKDVNK